MRDPKGFEGGAVKGVRRSSPVHSSAQPSLREEAIPEHCPDQIPVSIHHRKVVLEHSVDLVKIQPSVEVDQNIPKAREV